MIPSQKSKVLLTLLGVAASVFAECTIPDEPLTNNITEPFSIYVQNVTQPLVHNRIMNFRANGDDKHLVLRPKGDPTNDTMYLENGLLIYEGRHAVIDLEYNPADDTTKMFMTDRNEPLAVFQPVYGCNPDTDELQIGLELVERVTDPTPTFGGQIGIQTAVDTYEFRYTPPDNPLLDSRWFGILMVIFRDGNSPPLPTIPTPTPAILNDYDYVSCWADPDGGRTLDTVSDADDMTNAKCASLCGGTPYIGTQYSRECWCGPQLNAGSAAAPEADCSNACDGDSTEACGGSRRLTLYKRKSTSGGGSSSTTTSAGPTSAPGTTTLSSSTTTASSASPTLPPVGNYDFVSCWAEPADGGRALTGAGTAADDMTLEKCAEFCSDYPYFGTEWGRECYCGVEPVSGTAAAPSSDCSFACAGDSTTTCGGSRRLSLYFNDAITGPQQPPTVGDYALYGCVTDSTGKRTLPDAALVSASMTLEACATFCAGYTFFGTEYGVECYCANAIADGAIQAALTDCSMTCGGNVNELCGNGDRLSLYQLAAH